MFTISINESTKHVALNTEYVTQFIIILNNRSKCLTVDNDNAENMYTGPKCSNNLVYFPCLSRPGKYEF